MLVAASGGPSLVVCSTCRHSADAREDADGVCGGAQLFGLLREAVAAEPRFGAIAVEPMPCLFACAEHCAVYLRAPGRVGYVLGRFTPDEAAARALLDFATAYVESAEGQVPYRAWPEGVKGHFLVRVPPEGAVIG